MRILTVVPGLGVGGTERAAANFALAYAELGHESRVWACRDGVRRADLEGAKINVVVNSAKYPTSAEWDPDIIHIHSNGIQEEQVRDLRYRFSHSYFVAQSVFAKPTPYDDCLNMTLHLSNDCLLKYRRRGGKTACALIPNPVDASPFFYDHHGSQAFRAQHGISEDDFVITRVGQPITYKWSPVLVRSFDRARTLGAQAHLVIVGPPKEVLHQVERSPWRKSIHVFQANLNDTQLRSVYSATDLFAHSAAQGESFGYVLVEAMLCEAPVLTMATPWADNSQVEMVMPLGYVAKSEKQFADIMCVASIDAGELIRGQALRNSMLHRFERTALANQVVELATTGTASRPCHVSPPLGSSFTYPSKVRQILGETQHRITPKVKFGAWRWIPWKLLSRLGS